MRILSFSSKLQIRALELRRVKIVRIFFAVQGRRILPTSSEDRIAFNGHSMVGRLHRVLVCSPWTAGWNHPIQNPHGANLGFIMRLIYGVGAACRAGEGTSEAGAEIVELPAGDALSLDAVYTHDASLATDFGLILMRPGKANRVAEAQHHGASCAAQGVPTFGEISPPGTTEAGDILWLDSKTLLIGHGYRTNAAGIAQMRTLLSPKGVEVLSAPLALWAGTAACLHLMSLISLLDERTALVDLPWLAVETVELLKGRGFSLCGDRLFRARYAGV